MKHGGELLRVELSHMSELGSKHAWAPSRPIVQWAVER
jgi:precorrin-6B C5,15-methyltransferase / cobalt-precorrin-6B C5,C15-methyltransferase